MDIFGKKKWLYVSFEIVKFLDTFSSRKKIYYSNFVSVNELQNILTSVWNVLLLTLVGRKFSPKSARDGCFSRAKILSTAWSQKVKRPRAEDWYSTKDRTCVSQKLRRKQLEAQDLSRSHLFPTEKCGKQWDYCSPRFRVPSAACRGSCVSF